VLPKKTSSVVETIALTLEKLKTKEPFFIKDSDSCFNIDKIEQRYNYLCVFNLNNTEYINVSNKSYVLLNEQGNVIDTAEKKVISSVFSVGGYFFKNPTQFLDSYNKIKILNNIETELYISHIIKYLIGHGEVFKAVEVKEYLDWGTVDDWFNWISRYRSYIINLEGIICYNTERSFGAKWEKFEPIERNVRRVNELFESGNQIFIITSRSEKYRKITERQLKQQGVKYHKLIMDCLHSKKILVNDFSLHNRYPSVQAVNIIRDSDHLDDLI
jgi:hypothetical protein